MSWLILSCSMQLITSGYFSGTEDYNYSPVKANAALTSLITVEKEEWRGQVDRCCLSMSSVNDAFVALWEELSSYEEESYHTKWTVSCNSNFFENFLWQSFPSYGIAMGTVIEEFPVGITHSFTWAKKKNVKWSQKSHWWWPKHCFPSAIQYYFHSNWCFLLAFITILAFFAFDQESMGPHSSCY